MMSEQPKKDNTNTYDVQYLGEKDGHTVCWGESHIQEEINELYLNALYVSITPYGDRILPFRFQKNYNPTFYKKILHTILDEHESVYCSIPVKCPLPYCSVTGKNTGHISGVIEIYQTELEQFFQEEQAHINTFRLPDGEIVTITSPKNGFPVKMQSLQLNLPTFNLLKTKYGFDPQHGFE